MKQLKSYLKIAGLISLFLVVLTQSSCKKDFLDVNNDPNNPLDATPSVLLPNIEGGIAYAQGGDMSRYASIFVQQTLGNNRQAQNYTNYIFSNVDFDNLWRFNIYAGPLQDLIILEQKATTDGLNHYLAIAKVLKAYTLGITTDCFGDIPYSEAFQGVDKLQPKFDTQESVYAEMQKLLDDAIVLLAGSPGPVVPGGDDLIYKGNSLKWTKLANALKARYYLHTLKRDPSGSTKALTALAGAMESNDDDAAFNFGSAETEANPWYQFNDQRGDIVVEGVMADTMVSLTDPRVDQYVDTANGNAMGAFYGAATSPVFLMTYAEQKFIEAELKFKAGDALGASSAHNDAVKANILKVTGAANVGYETTHASETAVSIDLNKIMLQKYIALFTSPESWTDYRRTGIPALTPPSGATENVIPRRFLYPQSEDLYNKNTPQGVKLIDKVWWDN